MYSFNIKTQTHFSKFNFYYYNIYELYTPLYFNYYSNSFNYSDDVNQNLSIFSLPPFYFFKFPFQLKSNNINNDFNINYNFNNNFI